MKHMTDTRFLDAVEILAFKSPRDPSSQKVTALLKEVRKDVERQTTQSRNVVIRGKRAFAPNGE